MMRHWFLTNTCYGNWLPGDPRGFVGRVREHRDGDEPDARRVEHRTPGTPYDRELPGLQASSARLLKCPPIRLDVEHARVLLDQFLATAAHRNWTLLAVSILVNHFHLVVAVSDDPPPGKILGDFKSWGSRALNARFGEPPSKTWWTAGGSKRKLPDARAVARVTRYVLAEQPNPLVTWTPGS
jgi:REP element-mobilizing transposase RayT